MYRPPTDAPPGRPTGRRGLGGTLALAAVAWLALATAALPLVGTLAVTFLLAAATGALRRARASRRRAPLLRSGRHRAGRPPELAVTTACRR